jgi:ABC-type multidrug transport system fused ATPase/permease subunit
MSDVISKSADDADCFYRKHFTNYTEQLKKVQQQINLISNVRLAVAVAAIAGAVFAWKIAVPLFLVTIICGVGIFFVLVVHHEQLHKQKKRIEHCLSVLQRFLNRLNNKWIDYSDTGEEFIDGEHPYSTDLDIFGKGSLFQWVSSAHTFYGRKQLASDLLDSPKSIEQIKERQGAVNECASSSDFRLAFEAASLECDMRESQDSLLKWAESKVNRWGFLNSGLIVAEAVVVACIAISSIIFFNIPQSAYVLYSLHLGLFLLFRMSNMRYMDTFEKNGARLLVFSELLSHIEKTAFNDKLLCAYKKELFTQAGSPVSAELKKLAKIVSSMEVRYNPLGHFVANTALLWDFQLRVRAEVWKRNNGKKIRKWLEIIGHFESLNSFAAIAFENHEWCYPTLSGKMSIDGDSIGHPLIQCDKRINNSFSIQDNQVAIITGSNMSGKSTFLRTVGVNAVLAYAGAPVCAKSMNIPVLRIFSSMRIGDDLSSNVSTFYAELLKIKRIITADKEEKPILYLLDELFRGTNSTDRHEGAVAVLAKLKQPGNIGLISTHDLKLCELATEPGNGYINYHFSESYDEHGIAFDYVLKNGPSTTRNALYLIKMVGIV